MDAIRLNPFNQYDGDENRLTHALAITLERSKAFQTAFINLCGAKRRLGKDIRVEIQVVMSSDDEIEETAIPDLILVDTEQRGLIFEVKVGSSLDPSQLQRHEARAKTRKDIVGNIVWKYVITGRSSDAKIIRKGWQHIEWIKIYEIANRLKVQCEWARDLADYLEIVATQIENKGMNSKVKLTTFTGIPFKNVRVKRPTDAPNLYEPRQARRHLSDLMDSLEEDKRLLSELGFAPGKKPKRRVGVEATDSVWDYLSPMEKDGHHTKTPHFTVEISKEHASAMLTIPNQTKVLRHFVKKHNSDDFIEAIKIFLRAIGKHNLNKAGCQPCIVTKQRRYRTIREVYAVDGNLTFDLRTFEGLPRTGNSPPIRTQPEWTKFCYQLLRDKKSNIQFQIGMQFIYGYMKKLDQPEAVIFFKSVSEKS
jgi:hypothetical protein